MTTKLELEAAVSTAQTALNLAQQALEAFNDAPENNQFDDIEKAHSAIEDKLYGKAHKACEGSHCCGLPKYTQEFIVNGTRYVGTLTVEYNRHDKTYYYVEESEFTYKLAE